MVSSSVSLRREFRLLLRLSWPVALSQVGIMMTGVVDSLMLGRVSVQALAASALGNMWQWAFLAVGLGVVMGVDPLISQAHGRGDGPAAGLALQRGLVAALLISVPLCIALAFTEEGLLLFGQEAGVAALAGHYNILKLPTIPCFLVYSALRQYLQGRTLMAPATWVIWIANGFNVVVNWALIFGHLGFAAHGLGGAAVASSLTGFFLVFGLWLWIKGFKLHLGAWRSWDLESVRLSGLRRVFELGFPVGLQLSLESWTFALTVLMAGWLGVSDLSAHHVVLNMAALTFMMPLGISQGAATRVGNLIGASDGARLKPAIISALALGAIVMSGSALIFTLFRAQLPLLYTTEPAVVALAASIYPLAGAFQLFDGLQVVSGGILRGMGRPAAAAWVNLVGYYVFALPIGYLLAFHRGWGLKGLWTALFLGLVVVAAGLTAWVFRLARKPIAELQVAG